LNNFKQILKFKKNIEHKFKCVLYNDFFDYFLESLKLKSCAEELISKDIFNTIIIELITLDFNQRSLDTMRDKLKKF
jgi:hypothetical protein